MRKTLIGFAFLALSGCASLGIPQAYEFAAPEVADALAMASAEKLHEQFPPASTQFFLAEPAKDQFGQTLTTRLRQQGFAVAESPTVSGVALGYVVDSYEDGLYRVTLNADNTSLHRAFLNTEPLGVWSQTETTK